MMEKKKKIQAVIVVFLLVIVGVGLVFYLFGGATKDTSKATAKTTVNETAVNVKAPVANIQPPIPVLKNEKNLNGQVATLLREAPTPFSGLPSGGNNPLGNPNISNLPNSRGFPGVPSIPNAPSIPSGSNGNMQKGIVSVNAVFLGDNTNGRQNMAILSDGQNQKTVSEQEKTEWGFIDSIVRDGVTIDGKFIPFTQELKQQVGSGNDGGNSRQNGTYSPYNQGQKMNLIK